MWPARHKRSAAALPLFRPRPTRSGDPAGREHTIQHPGQGRTDKWVEEDGGHEHGFPPSACGGDTQACLETGERL